MANTATSSCRHSRRTFLGRTLIATLASVFTAPLMPHYSRAADGNTTLDIGSRRELFVDDFLIERLTGKAQWRLHHPEPRDIVLMHDSPWEGNGCGYHSLFQDGELYRMYYKAVQIEFAKGRSALGHPYFCCYAESDDGIRWRKPALGLHEFNGSKANNILLKSGPREGLSLPIDAPHSAFFRDENPDAAPNARYKAIIGVPGESALVAFGSPDGLRWQPIHKNPVLSEGRFDSQNTAFWDPVHRLYRVYCRSWSQGDYAGFRGIRTATSKDFIHWSPFEPVKYLGNELSEHLYTNVIKPYPRAPHLLIGFPTRYIDRGWTESMRALPQRERRELRASSEKRLGTAITEALFMTSRDGVRFRRWKEAFLRPGIERDGTWSYGQQYIAWHVVETKSALEGAPNELSFYATENYWTGNRSSSLRRYTMRLDGFVSVNAPMSGGELITRPLTFTGNELRLNFSSSAAGGIRVELLNAAGQAIPGFALADCDEVFGDSIDRVVTWKNGADVGSLAHKPVQLRFVLKDADLYAMQFTNCVAELEVYQ